MIDVVDSCKSEEDISIEWDRVALNRATSRREEKDKSFKYILLPKVVERAKLFLLMKQTVIIDVGCGCGELSIALSKLGGKIIGIDISAQSIEIAKKQAGDAVEFINSSVEKYVSGNKKIADICILNMVLSNVYDYKKMCEDVKAMLKKGGRAFITLPHPCYWPDYWGYNKNDWYDYKQQICMDADFLITGLGNMGKCTHIHRPLEMYINALIMSGFRICYVEELYSELSTGKGDYPYPRFLYIECEV